MTTRWTDEQRAVIDHRGGNLLVAAAAGSGKTAVLIERIIELIMDEREKIDIDKLLVVTFTKAAAREMRERVKIAIEKKLEQDPENEHLKRQLLLLNKAQITTIDSFCKTVVDNNFFMLDIDPNSKVADPDEIKIISGQAIEELFDEYYKNKDEDFLNLVDWYAGKNNDDALKELVLNINNFINSSPFPEIWLKESAEFFNVEDKDENFYIKNYLRPILQEVHPVVVSVINFLSRAVDRMRFDIGLEKYLDITTSKLEDTKILGDEIEQALNDEENFLEIFEVIKEKIQELEDKSYPRFVLTKAIKEKYPESQILYEELKDEVNSKFKEVVALRVKLNIEIEDIVTENKIAYKYMRSLSKVVLEFRRAFSQRKRSQNIVDFSDIEHFALDILTEVEDGEILPSEVAISYSNKFKEVFTDEYQDSNLVQEIILSQVAKRDNRFMVGDVKQSIYRFRQAMPEIFLEKYRSFKEVDMADDVDKKILLYNNFRSRAEVLEGCNHIFKMIMREETGELDYTDEEKLNPSAAFEDEEGGSRVGGAVEIFLVDSKEDPSREILEEYLENIKDSKGYISECMKISEIIDNLVNGVDSKGRHYKVYDKEINQYRRVKFKDIVILLRAVNSKSTQIEEVLSRKNIPVFADSGGEYFSNLEVYTMVNLLKIIDNPIQDIPLLSVMRSPIYDFSSQEIAEIRLVDKKNRYYDALKKIYHSYNRSDSFENNFFETYEDGIDEKNEDERKTKVNISQDLQKKVVRFLDEIMYFRKKSTFMSMDGFIWFLFKKTAYYTYVGTLEAGNHRQNNLMLLFEKAREFQKTNKGLYNFLNYIEKVSVNAKNTKEATSISEDADVVRIMSIHKSKGLEFPVVIVSNIDKKFNLRSVDHSLSIHQSLGYGPVIFDNQKKVKFDSTYKKIIDMKQRKESIAEEMRLLYVAMTRAKEKLIFTGMVKGYSDLSEEYKKTGKNEDGSLESFSVLSAMSYLNWIIPSVINLNKKDIFCSIDGSEKKYQGYGNCRWSIDVENYVDVVEKFEESVQTNDGKTLDKSKEKGISREDENIAVEEKIETTSWEKNNTAYEDKLTEEKFLTNEKCEAKNEVGVEEKLKNRLESKFEESFFQELDDKLNFKYKYISSMSKPSSISVSELKKIMSEDNEENHEYLYSKNWVSDLKSPDFIHEGGGKKGFSASEKGTIFHLVMQSLNFKDLYSVKSEKKTLRSNLCAQIDSLVEKNILSQEERDTVRIDWILRFISEDIFDSLAKADISQKLFREKAINYSININAVYKGEGIDDSEKMMMVGIIDAFFENEEGEIVLLDYKTDYVDDRNFEEIKNRYEIQLELYKTALESISSKKVSKKYIYLFSVGALVEY